MAAAGAAFAAAGVAAGAAAGAAVVAVVTEAYQREADEALAEPEPRPSAWQVSARALRQPLRREIGWGRFGG